MRSSPSRASVAGVVALAGVACSGPPPEIPVDPSTHASEVMAFHEAREAELAAPDSWVSLIGLHYLNEGETTMGSDPASDIVLPEGRAAARVGTFVRTGAEVRFVTAEGVRVTSGIDSTMALSAGSGAIPPDVSGDPAIVDEALGSAGPGKEIVQRHGAFNWVLIGSDEQPALRLRDNESANYDAFTGIDRYPVSTAWRVTARWVPQEKPILVPIVTGGSREAVSPAYLEFWIDGDRHTLDVTGDPDAERYMMVFADGTSGSGTYGAGRYLWFDAPDDEGRVVLDFNYAYNPPCVWTGYAVCPLPSRDNRLDVAVEAGEKDWVH